MGNGPVLGIDYHHRLSVAEAASFCQRLPKGTLDWIEEPIRDECPEAYEALRKLTEIPFAMMLITAPIVTIRFSLIVIAMGQEIFVIQIL